VNEDQKRICPQCKKEYIPEYIKIPPYEVPAIIAFCDVCFMNRVTINIKVDDKGMPIHEFGRLI